MSTLNQRFLNWEKASRDTIDVKRIYIDMAEDLISGLMLSQIVYWFLPNAYGASKLRVHKNGEDWIAKTYADWFQECRITKKQATACIQHLENLELIVTDIFHFGGKRATHIRINSEVFMEKFSRLVNNLDNPDFLGEYWNEIKEKDNRSNASKMVTYQNGNIPKRDVITSQKGSLQSDKKEGCSIYTKNTEKNTTKTTYPAATAAEKSEEEITQLETNPSQPLFSSKEDVVAAILQLVEKAREAQLVSDISKPTRSDQFWTERDTVHFKIFNEAFDILTSKSIDWRREGKHCRDLVSQVRNGKYTAEQVIYCIAWAYQVGKFEFYSMSSMSVPKLMPMFLDLYRTGKLQDSLALKPKFETATQRMERIYAERERAQPGEHAKLAEDYAKQTGVTKPARI